MKKIISKINKENFDEKVYSNYKENISEYKKNISNINKCGGVANIEKQHSKGRLTARERVDYLIDDNSIFYEIGKFAAFEMYKDFGEINSSGINITLAVWK